MRKLVFVALVLACATISAQRAVPGITPCSLVPGCVASYSAQRRMVSGYTGPLFQMSRTGGGGGTQDIGQTAAGTVNMATIATFCGTTSGSGSSTTTANTCLFHKIYDHTAKANTLQAVLCDSPYGVNARGLPIFLNYLPGAGACYFGNTSPTGTPTGNANASLYVVANDTFVPVEGNPEGYALDFGMLHDVAVANTAGSSYDLVLRGGPNLHFGPTDFLFFGVDLEVDVAELVYGQGDSSTAEMALSPNAASFSYVGDFTGTSSYATGSTNIITDFNNGQYTYTTPYASMNMGGGSPAQIREGYTGDNTHALPSAWYEGIISTSTWTLPQQRTLEANGQAFYQITPHPSCANAPRLGGVDLLGGASVVTGAWGLRQLDPNRRGPVALIDRVSDSTFFVLGTAKGTCDLNTGAAASFCASTTCHVYFLFNQVQSIAGHLDTWTVALRDLTQLTSSGSLTTGPTITFNCRSALPCLTFGSSSTLVSAGSPRTIARPWSLLAALTRTNASGGAFFTTPSNVVSLGAAGANTLQVEAGTGTFSITNADSAWHAVAGTVPTNTSLVACSNGVCSTSGVVSTADGSSSAWTVGAGGFTGSMTELYLVNGTAVSAAQIAALSAAERAWGGF